MKPLLYTALSILFGSAFGWLVSVFDQAQGLLFGPWIVAVAASLIAGTGCFVIALVYLLKAWVEKSDEDGA